MRSSIQVQLPTRGKPSAFDVCRANLLCVASPGCLTIFHLSNPTVPRQVIHYEQPQPVDKLKLHQRGELVGILRAGVVSIWDPNRELRPLVGLLKSSGPIMSLDWSSHSSELLMTGCSGGSVRVWDARSHTSAVQQISLDGLGSCSGVEWCPTNPYLFSATSYGERVFLFDARMAGSTSESPYVCSVEPKAGVRSSLWLQDPAFMGDKAGMLAVSTNDGLEFWDASFGKKVGRASSLEAECRGENKSAKILQSSIVLATARGLGVVSCSLIGKEDARNDNTAASSVPNDSRGLFDVSLHSAVGNSEGGSSSVELAKLNAGGILGCFWTKETDLSGVELVCFTESSSLLCIKVPAGIFGRMRTDISSGSSGGTGKEKDKEVTPRPTLSTALPKTGKLQAPPRYSLASLRDSSAQLAPLTRLESKEEVPGSDSAASATRFWVGLRGGVLSLEDLAQRGELTGLSAGRIDQYARQVSLSLSFQAMTAADVSEVLHNVTTSTFTAAPVLAAGQDRVIALIVRFPASSLPSFALRGLEGQEEEKVGSDLTAALGVLSRSIGTATASAEDGSPDERTFLVQVATRFRQAFLPLAITSLDKQSAVTKEAKSNAIAEERRDRVVDAVSEEGAKTQEAAKEEVMQEEKKEGGSIVGADEEVEEGKGEAEVAVVDALAYRVPCPADGGACWGPGGRLVCFGRSALSFGTTSSSPDDDDEERVGPSLEKQVPISRVTSGVAGVKAEPSEAGAASSMDKGGMGTEASHTNRDNPRSTSTSKVSDVLKLGSDIMPACDGEDGIIAGDAYPALFGSEMDPDSSGRGGASQYPKSLGNLLVIRLAEKEAAQRRKGAGKEEDLEELDLLSSPETPRYRRRMPRGSSTGGLLGVASGEDPGNTDGDESIGIREDDIYSDSDSEGTGRSGDEEYGQRFGQGADTPADISRRKLYRQVTDDPKHLRGVHASLDRLGRRLDQQQEQKSSMGTALTVYAALSDTPRAAAQALSLGPVNCDTTTAPLWSAGFCVDGGMSSKYDANARELYIASLKERISACKHNALAIESTPALKRHFPHSVQQLWTLAASSLNLLLVTLERAGQVDKEGNTMLNWNSSIIGGRMLRKLLLMLVESRELQLLATVVCILGGSNHTLKLLEVSSNSPQAAKGYRGRSSSLSEAPLETEKLRRLLDRALCGYACILERWSLLTLATEVRNHIKWRSVFGLSDGGNVTSPASITSALPNSSTTEFALEQEVLCSPEACFRCGDALDGDESSAGNRKRVTASPDTSSPPLWWCRRCKDFSSYCSLCQMPLKNGPAFICMGCGHGGHVQCVKVWFKTSVECATGCGCRCAELALSLSYLQRQRASAAAVEVYDEDDVDEEKKDEKETADDEGFVAKTGRRVSSDESSASDSYSDSDYEKEDNDEQDESASDDSELELKGRYHSYFGGARDDSYLHEGWESD